MNTKGPLKAEIIRVELGWMTNPHQGRGLRFSRSTFGGLVRMTSRSNIKIRMPAENPTAKFMTAENERPPTSRMVAFIPLKCSMIRCTRNKAFEESYRIETRHRILLRLTIPQGKVGFG